ncbi:MAG: FAD-linked oxidase C-terminal domain-containing protein [Planctomycetaceae bacterium]|nr:FAD-linked oxidase C-terminal domain-containing protein [Planctomycetaceae bacterium]
MDARLSRIVEDLSDSFSGELSIDAVQRSLYGSDGSLYQVPSLAVACPKSRNDVIALVNYALENHLPLVPRGSGSSVTGGALGRGIVVDFSRHMRRVEIVDDDTVRVQPGVVLGDLNRQLRPLGRYFPPDPANAAVTTIGSMLAVDAAGSHAVSVGSTRDHVRCLEMITSGGDVWSVGLEACPDRGFVDASAAPPTRREQCLSRLGAALQRHAEEISRVGSNGLKRRGGGYYVYGALRDQHIDLRRLMIGSEGTLGLFTEATLHTLPLPEHRGAMLILFDTLETAARAVTRLVDEDPAACDLLDRRLLSLAREASTEFARLIPVTAEAALILEWSGWSAQEVLNRLDRYQRLIRGFVPSCMVQCEATTPAGADFLWSLPQQVVPMLHRLQGRERPLPFVEDIAVPPEYLEEYIFRAQKILQRHNVVSSLYAHAPTGQLHLRPFLPFPTQADSGQLHALADDLYQAAWHLGGTVSGEHGLGLVRTEFLERQAGSLYPLFREIKEIFDPQNLLNPGKVISDEHDLLTRDLRSSGPPDPAIHDLQLSWPAERLLDAANACNGCGGCRTQEPGVRMCPIFRIDADEAASPRAKANLVRQTLTGELPEHLLASPEFKRVADLCFNCRQCRFECPSSVDIPHLVQEIKAQYVAQNGLPRGVWFLTRAMDWGEWLNQASSIINPLLQRRTVRWAIERMFGVARERKLPAIAGRSFLSTAGSRRTAPPPMLDQRTVVYFVDYFANHHDTELAWACVQVLEKQGLHVHIPPRQLRCGMELISAGDAEWARAIAEHNVKILVEFAREGVAILCSEPTAAVCLKDDYPLLLGTPDAQLVADHTFEVGGYLQRLHSAGKLDVKFAPLPLRAAYHVPCHLRALGTQTPLVDLCRLIPALTTPRLEAGCSGMAGMFGMEARNFAASLRIGRELMTHMERPDVILGLTECSSCRLQMEQSVEKPTVHPLKLLAAAYGLMPELRARLLALTETR